MRYVSKHLPRKGYIIHYVIVNDGTDRGSWLEARKGGISATDAAAIHRGGAGAHAALRAEKAGATTGDFDNKFMRHGREREPFIAAFAQRRFGLQPSTALIGHPDNHTHLATPDGIGEATLGEYKTTIKDWEDEDAIPPRYLDQMDWQMYVAGAEACEFVFEPHQDFVPLYPEPRSFRVLRSEERIQALVDAVAEFEAQTGAQGPFQMDEEALLLDSLLSSIVLFRERAAAATADVAALEEQVRTILGDNGKKFEGTAANLTFTVGGTATRFSQSEFKDAHPDEYKAYLRTTASSPRLTITARSY